MRQLKSTNLVGLYEVRLFALGRTEWRVLEPQSGYAEGSRHIGLIDFIQADDQRRPRAGGGIALHVLATKTTLLQSAAEGRIELTSGV
ncbi:hypothetical protein [Micromonospora sp. NPDC048839]|uniref:hypothetical protein n=1 Tax=Micromonospora sp. NPDC048839 TaxID=3155641 RepID=UPI0033CE2635